MTRICLKEKNILRKNFSSWIGRNITYWRKFLIFVSAGKVSWKSNWLYESKLGTILLCFFNWWNLISKKIWQEFDVDKSGFIEANEIQNFVRKMFERRSKTNDIAEKKIIEYSQALVNLDFNWNFT